MKIVPLDIYEEITFLLTSFIFFKIYKNNTLL